MNDIAINLNHIDEELEKVLPPTDSRRWPDMRAMERGDYETADWEKKWLEDEQWAWWKLVKYEPPPNYFTKHVIDEKKGMYFYEYGKPREYWTDWKNQDWAHLKNLFE